MHNRKLVFSAACLGMLVFGISFITLGSVVPALKLRFGLDDLAAGALFSILPLGILAGSLAFGPCCDKYGYKILLVLSGIFLAAGFMGIAYAQTTGLLQGGVLLFGIGGGAMNGATNALTADISDENKTANLSLLGVCFGIGALGMPSLIGLLENHFAMPQIVSMVGLLTLIISGYMASIRFPPAKHRQGFPIAQSLRLIKDPLLVCIAFFLFCQSSFEALLNNWTTTYLSQVFVAGAREALFALSLFVAGMTVTRLLYGTVFRKAGTLQLLVAAFFLILIGTGLLGYSRQFALAATGLFLLGAGLAGGFPIMLGIVGSSYRQLSATAFSFALSIALLGNMLVNYFMGIVAHRYGIHQLIHFILGEWIAMTILGFFILKKSRSIQ